MADARKHTSPDDDDLRKLTDEGLLRLDAWIATWKNAPQAEREQIAVNRIEDLIAGLFGVTRQTAARWIAEGELRMIEGRANRCKRQRLAEYAHEIRRLIVGAIMGNLVSIALDKTHPRVVAAAEKVLPKLDPEGWGPNATELRVQIDNKPASDDVFRIPQAVFDELTDDERDRVFESQARIATLHEQVRSEQQIIDSIIAATRARLGQ